jgi:glutathione S-transferase
MNANSLILYADRLFTSPYVMSVFVTLEEKQLPYALITVDLQHDENHQPAYAARSLTQRVPMLVDGELAITESSAITEYLDEAYPAVPVYPRDRALRAGARQVQAWLRSDLLPIREERDTEVVFRGKRPGPPSSAARAATATLIAAAEALLPDGAPNLFGDWCIADTDLALMLQRVILAGDPVPERLRDYAAAQWQRPAVQRWCAQLRPAS